jgi:hypothetical protein
MGCVPEPSLGLSTMVNANVQLPVQNGDLSTALSESAYEISARSACVVTIDLFRRVLCSIEILVVLSVRG